MHISAIVLGLTPPVLIIASIAAVGVAGGALSGDITPARVSSAPFHGITPAPNPDHVFRRLLRARQGEPRSSDGRTNFIGWYSQSNNWVSATCPSQDYFAADDRFGVCCPRNSPYCHMATSCGGPLNNYAIGPSGQADCGPSNTCETITMLQTQGNNDARSIIFCIAMSEAYLLPLTWYRVTYPLPAAETTVTVTVSATTTATAQAGSHTGGQPVSRPRSPPARTVLIVAAVTMFLCLTVP